MKTQRDQFLEKLFEYAKQDESIILLSVDMGAPALDQWRTELPNQFFSMGISEQNAINVAAGLRRGGKKVFVYFMAIWVLRCFEQIRYSCAMAGNPITIIGNGVGLGYAPAGPAHEPNEDVAVMRSLLGIEIWSPSSVNSIDLIVEKCLENEKLNYVRLERKTHKSAEALASNGNLSAVNMYNFGAPSSNHSLAICSYGFMVGRAIEASQNYVKLNPNISIKLYDFQRIYPLVFEDLKKILKDTNKILIVEEQSSSGSFTELLASEIALSDKLVGISKINLPNYYIFENGTRDQLLDANGLSVNDIQIGIEKIFKLNLKEER